AVDGPRHRVPGQDTMHFVSKPCRHCIRMLLGGPGGDFRKCRDTCGGSKWISVKGSTMNRARPLASKLLARVENPHDLRCTNYRPAWEAASHHFCERGHVGGHAKTTLNSPGAVPEARNDLVEDEDDAILRGQPPQFRLKSRNQRHRAPGGPG